MPLGFRHSKESKQKMSLAMAGNKRGLGYKHTPEARAKISSAMIGNQRTLGCQHSPESRAKRAAASRGEKNNMWKGGRIIDGGGYVRLFHPDHPAAQGRGYIFEHRLVMEANLGRSLSPVEVVHHINGVKDDNRIENFALCQNEESHRAIHSGEIYLPC